jgi:hypothetical protein
MTMQNLSPESESPTETETMIVPAGSSNNGYQRFTSASDEQDLDPNRRGRESRRQHSFRSIVPNRTWIGAVLIVLALLTIASTYYQQQRIGQITGCQATYNSLLAQNIVERSELNDEDREATAALITEVFTVSPSATPAQRSARLLADYQMYQRTEAAISSDRAHRPFPTIPAKACS